MTYRMEVGAGLGSGDGDGGCDCGVLTGRSILASALKAASESRQRILSFFDPTTRWQRIICSSLGNLIVIEKKERKVLSTVVEEEEEMVEARGGLS